MENYNVWHHLPIATIGAALALETLLFQLTGTDSMHPMSEASIKTAANSQRICMILHDWSCSIWSKNNKSRSRTFIGRECAKSLSKQCESYRPDAPVEYRAVPLPGSETVRRLVVHRS